jgi:hypothetical protein
LYCDATDAIFGTSVAVALATVGAAGERRVSTRIVLNLSVKLSAVPDVLLAQPSGTFTAYVRAASDCRTNTWESGMSPCGDTSGRVGALTDPDEPEDFEEPHALTNTTVASATIAMLALDNCGSDVEWEHKVRNSTSAPGRCKVNAE